MSDDGWVSAGDLDELPDGKGAKVTVGEATVLLVRSATVSSRSATGAPIRARRSTEAP